MSRSRNNATEGIHQDERFISEVRTLFGKSTVPRTRSLHLTALVRILTKTFSSTVKTSRSLANCSSTLKLCSLIVTTVRLYQARWLQLTHISLVLYSYRRRFTTRSCSRILFEGISSAISVLRVPNTYSAYRRKYLTMTIILRASLFFPHISVRAMECL
jgi:hypothetical protein